MNTFTTSTSELPTVHAKREVQDCDVVTMQVLITHLVSRGASYKQIKQIIENVAKMYAHITV